MQNRTKNNVTKPISWLNMGKDIRNLFSMRGTWAKAEEAKKSYFKCKLLQKINRRRTGKRQFHSKLFKVYSYFDI